MSFSENGYQVVRNVVSKDLLYHLKTQFFMMRDIQFFETDAKNKFAFADAFSKKCFSVYKAPFFESLAIQLNKTISQITNTKLYPTYTFGRIYYEGAILRRHKDRPACEYSVTLCIDSTDIWDFYIKDKKGIESQIKLNPGDMCVYSGYELEHWRNPYHGDSQMQCFLHYVDSEGSFAEYKYNKMPMMGLGTQIPNQFTRYY